MRKHHHQAFTLQKAQGLAYRPPADLKLLGQPHLMQTLARGEIATNDLLHQLFRQLLRQCLDGTCSERVEKSAGDIGSGAESLAHFFGPSTFLVSHRL